MAKRASLTVVPDRGEVEVVTSRMAQVATLAYVVVGLLYLWWRTSHTVNLSAPLISIPFLLADYLGFAFFLLFAMTLWTRTKRHSTAAPAGLSVDVFVTTYDEDTDILRPTIAAVVAMDYPHATYVLDDGRRDSVRALCDEFGVNYLTRDDSAGAKAGNVNAALPRTSGDLIAFFDADHAPFANFLTELLGYFGDPTVAVAQAPQSYYNLDSFQHASRVRSRGTSPWHEQSVFYDALLPGKDRWNAVFWCGSGAVIRRTALEGVGGVDTRTVTEDMHTSMNIHAAGWRTVYHDRELAVGIAPDDADAFLAQRLRWTQGAVQIFRHDNPLLKRGLSLRQRVSYFASVAYVFEYVPKAVYLVMPIIALSVGALPMTNMGWNLLYRFLPYWAMGVVASRLLTGGTNPYFQSERFHLAKMTISLRAAASLIIPGRVSFHVTQKSGDGADHRFANLRLIRWQLAAGCASIAAVGWAAAGFWAHAAWQLSGVSLLITVLWAFYNAGMVASLAQSILRRHHRRHIYRFDVDLPATVTIGRTSATARVRDLSAIGVGWDSPLALQRDDNVKLRFETSPGAFLDVNARAVSGRNDGGGFHYGGEFTHLSESARRLLVLFLYQQHAPTFFGAEEPAQELTIDAPLRKAS